MGREIKRVALDFDWPMSEIWKGFSYPYQALPCYGCKEEGGESLGYSKQAQELNKQWYAFDNPRYIELENGRRYNDAALYCHLNQEDVQALVSARRLVDFTHTWTKGEGWVENSPATIPTADEVNEWAKRSLGHDSLNMRIVIRARLAKLGLSDECAVCGGSGELWQSPEIEQAAEAWKEIEPPSGDGWQLWETVSEGSPITPVFKTSDDLVDHLVNVGDAWGNVWTREQAVGMVRAEQAPSAVAMGGKVFNSQESVVL